MPHKKVAEETLLQYSSHRKNYLKATNWEKSCKCHQRLVVYLMLLGSRCQTTINWGKGTLRWRRWIINGLRFNFSIIYFMFPTDIWPVISCVLLLLLLLNYMEQISKCVHDSLDGLNASIVVFNCTQNSTYTKQSESTTIMGYQVSICQEF